MDSAQLTKLAAVAGASGAAVALLVAKLLLDGGARRAEASAPGDTPDDAKRSAHVEQGRLAVGQGLPYAVEQGLPYALQRRASVAQAAAEAYGAAVKPAPLHRDPYHHPGAHRRSSRAL